MKYYSEQLDRLFSTEKELLVAEAAEKEKQLKKDKEKEEKIKAKAEIDKALESVIKLIAEYNRKYGFYTQSFKTSSPSSSFSVKSDSNFTDLLDSFLS